MDAGYGVVDVIIPVHDNIADANRLFASIASARNRRPFFIHVIDDASIESVAFDLPEVTGAIRGIAVHRNPTNLGFAGSVNVGLKKSRHDVLILNSDTVVYDNWLDRLRAVAESRSMVATVTPLSNAATILSYPTFLGDYAGSLETEWHQIDRFCAEIAEAPVEIPTGVGFCMFIKRECLDAIGMLDDIEFRSGYGEECDFCRRAADRGWINVAAPNVFVWHRGHGTFRERAARLNTLAQERLERIHPGYARLIARFVKRDPLHRIRQRLDLLRLRAAVPRRISMRFRRVPSRWIGGWRPVIDEFAPTPNLPIFNRFSSARFVSRAIGAFAGTTCTIQIDDELPRLLAARLQRSALKVGLNVQRVHGAREN